MEFIEPHLCIEISIKWSRQRIPLQEMFFTYIYGGTPTMNIILGGILYLFNAIEPIWILNRYTGTSKAPQQNKCPWWTN